MPATNLIPEVRFQSCDTASPVRVGRGTARDRGARIVCVYHVAVSLRLAETCLGIDCHPDSRSLAGASDTRLLPLTTPRTLVGPRRPGLRLS